MDSASAPFRSRRPLRRVVLGSLAGVAWLAMSASVATADDSAATAPALDGPVSGLVSVPTAPGPDSVPAPSTAVPDAAGAVLLADVTAGGVPWAVIPAVDPVEGPSPDADAPALIPALPDDYQRAPAVAPDPDPVADPAPTMGAPAVPGPDPATVPALPVLVPDPVPVSKLPVPVTELPVPVSELPATVPELPATVPALPVPVPAIENVPLGDPASVPDAIVEDLPAVGDPALVPDAVVDGFPVADPESTLPAILPGKPVALDSTTADPVPSSPHPPSPAATEPQAAPAQAVSAVLAESYFEAFHPPVATTPVRLKVDGKQPAGVPPTSSSPDGSKSPSPVGKTPRTPLPTGKDLPGPDALPAAPGSGSGKSISSGGQCSGAAWLPSLYLITPTAAAEPVRGPLQHAYSAAAADRGSSPD